MDEADRGKPPLKTTPVLVLFGAATVLFAAAALPGLARDQDGLDPSPIDVMADAVLIDVRCGTIPVDMGALLQYGESHGIEPLDIMPTGSMRKTFETALDRRSRNVTQDTLCTSVVAREQDLAPGVIKAP